MSLGRPGQVSRVSSQTKYFLDPHSYSTCLELGPDCGFGTEGKRLAGVGNISLPGL